MLPTISRGLAEALFLSILPLFNHNLLEVTNPNCYLFAIDPPICLAVSISITTSSSILCCTLSLSLSSSTHLPINSLVYLIQLVDLLYLDSLLDLSLYLSSHTCLISSSRSSFRIHNLSISLCLPATYSAIYPSYLHCLLVVLLWQVHLCIYLSTYLPICLSGLPLYPSTCLSTDPSFYLSISVRPSIYRSTCLM